MADSDGDRLTRLEVGIEYLVESHKEDKTEGTRRHEELKNSIEEHKRDTKEDFETTHTRITKNETDVSRIKGIGATISALFAAALTIIGWNK